MIRILLTLALLFPACVSVRAQAPSVDDIYPCRTAEETCFVGVVVGGRLAVVFTNAPDSEGIVDSPVDVYTDPSPTVGRTLTRLDLAEHEGRAVFLTGEYVAGNGVFRAELVEVAGPLLSLVVKTLSLGGEEDIEDLPPATLPGGEQDSESGRPR